MNDILQTISQNIYQYRKALGISQESLAEKAGLHRTYLGSVERGERNISAQNIEKIAKALCILPHKLLLPEGHLPPAASKATVIPVDFSHFNHDCILPFGLTFDHVYHAMKDFTEFLDFINRQLVSKKIPRLEEFLMAANFSSIVGEYINTSIPKYCKKLVKNRYHNGHPDLIPAGKFPDNSVQYSKDGIEVKGSRYSSGWQGHNPETVWLMIFYFDCCTARTSKKEAIQKPFYFRGAYTAKLLKSDRSYSGRSSTSRRTITASVNKEGARKMKENWIYQYSPND
jgi:transcriptional regulator with XRE-family HTH domain